MTDAMCMQLVRPRYDVPVLQPQEPDLTVESADYTRLESVVDQLLGLINSGELSPGQRVDQRAVAERLNVSRTPLREALMALNADGILAHEKNRGYSIKKLGASDLLQYHVLRHFIEQQLAESVVWPEAAALAELKRLHKTIAKAGESAHLATMATANREFHFLIFSWSPQRILFQELKRIWRITDAYQIAFFSTPESRRAVTREHGSIIRAIESRDRRRFKQVTEKHSDWAAKLLQELQHSQDGMPPFLMRG